MSVHDYAEIAPLDWSELAVSELPTGTVTLLLADIEGSTRLWETRRLDMAAAIERLNAIVSELVAAHGGVRPLEQGEGDSFVVAFAKASDAVACALALQRAPVEPTRLRIGLHTGEIQLRDEANYAGPTINRAARLRDLAHGGQTVLSGATEAMVLDRLPEDAWLADLGSHVLRDLPRQERVLQLNHPDVRVEFPPLRVTPVLRRSRLPVQLTSFVGRAEQVVQVGELLGDNRLVTLTGAGGAGKTRLAIRVAAEAEADFDGEVFFVDLAPITDPAVVPVSVARSLELTDQPGRTTTETIQKFVRDRKLLVVLDNCEHLLDAIGALAVDILHAGAQVSVLATSREPIGIPGELTWRVPSLSTDDEAVELFVDRARRARSDFCTTAAQSTTVTEICRRLDGMPLAIELAAARTRTLALPQILESLRTSFRVLTGGARTAVRRQQTLSASIDWSHSLLTDPEQVLLRRLAAFAGGFDLDAAHTVGAGTDTERAQLIDVLGLLVDKSLVVADDSGGDMRYRLLETVRQYSMERLAASGEADVIRTRHRDHYAVTAAAQESQTNGEPTQLVSWAEIEMDNLRAAYGWSCEIADFATALTMLSSLQRVWLTRSRFREGLAGFESVFADERYRDEDMDPATWVRAVADAAHLAVWLNTESPESGSRADVAVAAARETGDQHLIARALMGSGMLSFDRPELGGSYLAEAVERARTSGDQSTLCQALGYQTFYGVTAGAPGEARIAGENGREAADLIGDRFMSRYSRVFLANALSHLGTHVLDAIRVAQDVIDEARADADRAMEAFGLMTLGHSLVSTGSAEAGESAAAMALDIGARMGGFHEDSAYVVLALAALGRGDAVQAKSACEAALQHTYARKELFIRSLLPMAEAVMCCGDLAAARRWADDSVAVVPGAYQVWALAARARVAIAQGEPDQAERDAYKALAVASTTGGYLRVPDVFECLAAVDVSRRPLHAARLYGAAHGIRQRHHEARLTVFQEAYDAVVTAVRAALGPDVFEAAWSDGQALSTTGAIAFAQRGRGERGRPASGWESLTPTEHDVVRLVSEGLANKDIAARLFISPRTVQTHLTHVYRKLDVSSRVQLVQEAARHKR